MLVKEADLKNSITDYFKSKSDLGLINLLAPSVVGVAVNAIFGTTWIGRGIDLLLRMVGVDFQSLLGSLVTNLCNEIRAMALFKGKNLSVEDVESKVKEKVTTAMPSANTTIESDLTKTQSYQYKSQIYKISSPIIKQSAASSMAMTEGLVNSSNFLIKSLSFIFKVALASAGMELFADIFKGTLGLKSDLDVGFLTGIFSSDLNRKVTAKKSKQTKFAKNPKFINEEVSKIYGNKDRKTIKDIYTSWANEVYLNINQQDLNNSKDLEKLVDVTIQINENVLFGNFFIVPNTLPTKQDVVDFFIDDVANPSSTSEKENTPLSNTGGKVSLPKESPSAAIGLKTEISSKEKEDPIKIPLTQNQQKSIDKIKEKGFPVAAEHAKQKLLKISPNERDAMIEKAEMKLNEFEKKCRTSLHYPSEKEIKDQIDSV